MRPSRQRLFNCLQLGLKDYTEDFDMWVDYSTPSSVFELSSYPEHAVKKTCSLQLPVQSYSIILGGVRHQYGHPLSPSPIMQSSFSSRPVGKLRLLQASAPACLQGEGSMPKGTNQKMRDGHPLPTMPTCRAGLSLLEVKDSNLSSCAVVRIYVHGGRWTTKTKL